MKRLHYHLLDVFTDRAFGGNPLAVFLEGEGIPEAMMQAIAKELNLSETTFVLPPGGFGERLPGAHLHAGGGAPDGGPSDDRHGLYPGKGRTR